MNRILLLLMTLLPLGNAWAAFDHAHPAWTDLLKKHVVVIDGGKTSQVRYAGFARDRVALKAYLDSLSAVAETEYQGWSKDQQLAFLLNAYNAFTVRQDPAALSRPQVDPRFRHLRGQPVEGQVLPAPGQTDAPRQHRARHHPRAGRVR